MGDKNKIVGGEKTNKLLKNRFFIAPSFNIINKVDTIRTILKQ